MKLKVICGVLIPKDNKFLFVQEKKKHLYGKWGQPGGHLEDDEDVFNCAIREVKEETGLDIKLTGLVGIYQDYHKRSNANGIKIQFEAKVIGGKLKIDSNEILQARWLSFEEVDKLKTEELRHITVKEAMKDYKKRGAFPLDIIKSTIK
jgi:8-oxo-dGTP diphosphatase